MFLLRRQGLLLQEGEKLLSVSTRRQRCCSLSLLFFFPSKPRAPSLRASPPGGGNAANTPLLWHPGGRERRLAELTPHSAPDPLLPAATEGTSKRPQATEFGHFKTVCTRRPKVRAARVHLPCLSQPARALAPRSPVNDAGWPQRGHRRGLVRPFPDSLIFPVAKAPRLCYPLSTSKLVH